MAPERASSSRASWTLPRLLVLLLVVAVAPSLLIQGLMLNRWLAATVEKEQMLNLEFARAVGAMLEAYVTDVAGTLGAMSDSIAEFGPQSEEAIDRFLTSQARAYPALSDISMANPSGVVVASSAPMGLGLVIGDRDYFQNALNAPHDSWVISDLLLGRARGAERIVIARPVHRNGQVLGVLAASMHPDRLARVTSELQRIEGGTALLFDRKGMLVYRHPRLEFDETLRGAWYNAALAAALAGKEQVAEAVSPITGERVTIARVPIGRLGWVAGAGRSLQQAYAPVWR